MPLRIQPQQKKKKDLREVGYRCCQSGVDLVLGHGKGSELDG